MGQKRNGFRLSKKEDKYVTEVDHPVAQKTENSHKRRNPKGHSKDLEIRQTSPKDVRCIEAYSMKDQFDEIAEKSSDILDEGVEKGVSSLIITDFEQYQEKTQCRRPTCPPGFSDLPPLLSYNVEKGMASLIITDCKQDQEKNQCRGPTCPPGFSDLPPLSSYNVGKGMSSLIVNDCEKDERGQEKNQRQGPTCPPGFSDDPPLPAYNTRARNNIEDLSEAEDDQVKIPASFKVFQDIIDNWGREYSMGREYAMGPWF